jgi:hypothetical protein
VNEDERNGNIDRKVEVGYIKGMVSEGEVIWVKLNLKEDSCVSAMCYEKRFKARFS